MQEISWILESKAGQCFCTKATPNNTSVNAVLSETVKMLPSKVTFGGKAWQGSKACPNQKNA